jgi:hypothetical protein
MLPPLLRPLLTLALCLSLHHSLTHGCRDLLLTSEFLGDRPFTAVRVSEAVAAGLLSGHSAFTTTDTHTHTHTHTELPTLYLYHTVLADGRGRWVINTELGALGSAIAYLDSWVVTPTLTHALHHSGSGSGSGEKHWQRYEEGQQEFSGGDGGGGDGGGGTSSGWVDDPLTFFQCRSGMEDTLYLSALGSAFMFSGFFVRRADSPHSQVYSHVGESWEPQKYLFKNGDSWVIGEEVGGERGLAYVLAPSAVTPAEIEADAVWRYIVGDSEWTPHHTTVVVGDGEEHVYSKLWAHRRISHLPHDASHFTLRNGLTMPALGKSK